MTWSFSPTCCTFVREQYTPDALSIRCRSKIDEPSVYEKVLCDLLIYKTFPSIQPSCLTFGIVDVLLYTHPTRAESDRGPKSSLFPYFCMYVNFLLVLSLVDIICLISRHTLSFVRVCIRTQSFTFDIITHTHTKQDT